MLNPRGGAAMSIQSVTQPVPYQDRLVLAPRETAKPRRRPLVMEFTVLTFAALTLLVLSVICSSRMQSISFFVELPQRVLPGSAFPKDAYCPEPAKRPLFCVVHQDGK